MSIKLYGDRFCPWAQEILHTSYVANAPLTLVQTVCDDNECAVIKPKAPTGTFPFLETEDGTAIGQSKAMELYICEQFKKELLGNNPFEHSQVHQWIDYATLEITNAANPLIDPIFGYKFHPKEVVNNSQKDLKKRLEVVEKHLEGKEYLVGNNMTLADIILFNKIRFVMQFLYPQQMRDNLFKNLTKWFTKIMETPEAKKAYGRIILCKQVVKAHIPEKKKEEKKKEEKKKEEKPKEKKDEEEKPKAKPKNPLDELPPSKLDLETFKRAFLNNKDKADAMNKFWEEYDPEGYSLWWMEYQNLPEEGKVLFRTSNSKGMFLQKLDNFRKYAFAVHGVYGKEGDYKIRGVWMWRGTDIPNEMKEHDNFPYMTIRKLDINKPEDKQLVNDYWTKVNETDEVEGRLAADVEYFN